MLLNNACATIQNQVLSTHYINYYQVRIAFHT